MSQIMLNSVRQLAQQRSFKLYQDQYDLMEKIEKTRNIELNKAELIREGVDLVLKMILQDKEGAELDGK